MRGREHGLAEREAEVVLRALLVADHQGQHDSRRPGRRDQPLERMRRSCCELGSCRTPQPLAEDAGRSEDQDEHEHHEGDDVGPLRCRCTATARDEDLDLAEQQAADHGAADVADAAEHGRGERLDAGHEAHGVADAEGGAEQEAGGAGRARRR